jgi:deoxyribodipyrimidine photo-lyase
MLRNLKHIQSLLKRKNIPLYIHIHPNNRFKLSASLISTVIPSLKASHIFGNIEYEVDELRRDIEMVKLGHENKIKAIFVHDRLAVPPGTLKSGKGTPYGVYSPWQRRK